MVDNDKNTTKLSDHEGLINGLRYAAKLLERGDGERARELAALLLHDFVQRQVIDLESERDRRRRHREYLDRAST